MPVEILCEEGVVPAHIESMEKAGASVGLPVDLAPGEELRFRVVADGPLPAQGAMDALFDVDDVKVHPNREAIWDAILDPAVPAEHTRTIKVIGDESQFAPRTDIKAVVLDFERIPGVSRDFVLEHVRAGKQTFTDEILRAGFELVAEVELEGLEENYFLSFRRLPAAP